MRAIQGSFLSDAALSTLTHVHHNGAFNRATIRIRLPPPVACGITTNNLPITRVEAGRHQIGGKYHPL